MAQIGERPPGQTTQNSEKPTAVAQGGPPRSNSTPTPVAGGALSVNPKVAAGQRDVLSRVDAMLVQTRNDFRLSPAAAPKSHLERVQLVARTYDELKALPQSNVNVTEMAAQQFMYGLERLGGTHGLGMNFGLSRSSSEAKDWLPEGPLNAAQFRGIDARISPSDQRSDAFVATQALNAEFEGQRSTATQAEALLNKVSSNTGPSSVISLAQVRSALSAGGLTDQQSVTLQSIERGWKGDASVSRDQFRQQLTSALAPAVVGDPARLQAVDVDQLIARLTPSGAQSVSRDSIMRLRDARDGVDDPAARWLLSQVLRERYPDQSASAVGKDELKEIMNNVKINYGHGLRTESSAPVV
jgi:hypothetical protein